ncbi:MAG: hypothetical protein QG620_162 [Patescibacteria group bacterium]|nr:hypothetical protein [Patescibacteria group bacterium]
MQNSLEQTRKRLEEIIALDDIQKAFKLEKELEEGLKKYHFSDNDKNIWSSLLYKLRGHFLPWATSNKFENLIQNDLLNLLQSIDINLKDRFNLRVMPFPKDSQDFVKIDYLKMFLKNREFIGKITISRWLKEYEEFVNYKQGTSLDKKNFLASNKNSTELIDEEKTTLIKVLDIFDYIKPSFDYKDDIINQKIYDTPSTEAAVATRSALNNMPPEAKLIKLSFSDALKKYPELGEQLVTSNKIRLKSFPDSVRPSIKNWLSDYTFNLGYENHNTIVRGNYLFQNENARALNSLDREKLSYVLKSFDENGLVTVNITTKQIVFPAPSRSNEQETMNNRISNPPNKITNPSVGSGFRPEPASRNIEPEIRTERIPEPAKTSLPSNNNMDKMQFSSPQTLPFEKEKLAPQSLPLRITPIPRKNVEERELPRNLVNLKE